MKITEKTDKRIRVILLLIYDIVAVLLAEVLALFVRFEFSVQRIPFEYKEAAYDYSIINLACTFYIFLLFQLYSSLWRYASIMELLNIVLACILSGVVSIGGMKILNLSMPNSYYFLYVVFLIMIISGGRFSYRLLRIWKRYVNSQEGIITMVIGAGMAGEAIIRELKYSTKLKRKVACIVDDDPELLGKRLQGVRICGNRRDIPDLAEKYCIQEIIIAIPTMESSSQRELIDICKLTGCKMKILPGTYQIIKGEVSVSKLREVQIEDLLGRAPIQVKLDSILDYVKGKVILVTGGGGSIGSELCRQIAAHEPKQLVIFDIYENNAYEIQQELKRNFPELNLAVQIGSVRDTRRIEWIFENYRPQIVYHAAAHKHVPLMEDSPNEAIKNNVFGTYKTAMAASKYQTERFVLISTDKAVNPTNIMGASKRLCEMVVQCVNRHSSTEFVAVRFGNVLGSNGSVIPLFKEQIAQGGPVTVTHPDIIRYFMTIPEAVSLVLQAGAFARGGEIFILDMGEPVKIDDLARNLIRLSGYVPDVDIPIVYSGLRPGEKLYEELLMNEEGLASTDNKLIFVGKPIEMNDDEFMGDLAELKDACYHNSSRIKEMVEKMVPTYHRKKE